LLDANLSQTKEPLIEVTGLLTTLAEAWCGIQSEREPVEAATAPEVAPADSRPTPSPWMVLTQQVPLQASGQRAWSF